MWKRLDQVVPQVFKLGISSWSEHEEGKTAGLGLAAYLLIIFIGPPWGLSVGHSGVPHMLCLHRYGCILGEKTHVQGLDGAVPDDVRPESRRRADNDIIVNGYMFCPQGLALLGPLVGVVLEADGRVVVGGGIET